MSQPSSQLSTKIFLFGTGFFFMILMLVAGLAVWAYTSDRRSAAYPNSQVVSQHSVYRFPRHYRWDDTFATADEIDEIYIWYSLRYGTGPESRANGGCFLLEGENNRTVFTRFTSIMICEMGEERLIFINRSTELFP